VQAVILAGGEGTRLRPLTTTIPKPVVPLVNRPFISYMIDWLCRHDVDEVVMSCGFLASEVKAVLGEGDGEVTIRYVEEDEPLGTAGAVKHAEDVLGERFAVLNGDILADFDLTELQAFHRSQHAPATIALIPVDDPSSYGLVRTRDGVVAEFVEKPDPAQVDTDLINAGAYVLEHEVLDRIAKGRPTSFEREVFPSLVGSGLRGFPVRGYWLDIGTPERYLEATFDILAGRLETVLDGDLGNDRLAVPRSARVSDDATILPPALLGERCVVEAGAQVGELASIGDECRIGEGAVVERGVLLKNVLVGADAVVRESVVGPAVRIGSGSRVEGGAVIGEGAVIGPNRVISGAETIEPGVEVS
jgi:mannose-1-phosphate guanylyltransferase